MSSTQKSVLKYFSTGDDEAMSVIAVEDNNLVIKEEKEDSSLTIGEFLARTGLPENAWQTMFFNEKYKCDLLFLSQTADKDLAADLGFAQRKALNGKLKPPAVKIDPISSVLTKGIRHPSEASDIIEECPSWIPHIMGDEARKRKFGEIREGESAADTAKAISGLQGAWSGYRNIFYLHRIFDEYCEFTPAELRTGSRSGAIWTRGITIKPDNKGGKKVQPLKLESLELEHYFECRFAGPMLSALIKRFPDDKSLQDAIVILDRIVNSPNNLVWTPKSLNTKKKKYFGGTACKADDEYQGLVRYLDQCSLSFRGLIQRLIKSCLTPYGPKSIVVGMLKVLWDSPFCRGYWGTLPPDDRGRFQWKAYNNSNQRLVVAASSSSSGAKGWGYFGEFQAQEPDGNESEEEFGTVPVVDDFENVRIKKEEEHTTGTTGASSSSVLGTTTSQRPSILTPPPISPSTVASTPSATTATPRTLVPTSSFTATTAPLISSTHTQVSPPSSPPPLERDPTIPRTTSTSSDVNRKRKGTAETTDTNKTSAMGQGSYPGSGPGQGGDKDKNNL